MYRSNSKGINAVTFFKSDLCLP